MWKPLEKREKTKLCARFFVPFLFDTVRRKREGDRRGAGGLHREWGETELERDRDIDTEGRST